MAQPSELSEGEVAHFLQQRAEVVARGDRARMPIAEVALVLQERAEVVDGGERARMAITEGLAPPL